MEARGVRSWWKLGMTQGGTVKIGECVCGGFHGNELSDVSEFIRGGEVSGLHE